MNSALRYYRGIAQQLRAEVDSINTIFEHQGVKGEGNETILRDLIAKFIPKRYGVGTGIVIDRQGKQSKQCDIIIYDTLLYPSFMSLATVHFFPVDIVYATIEVKTTLDAGSAKQARENIASVRALDYIKDQFVGSEPRNGSSHFINYDPEPPQGYIFAYNSNTQNFKTFKQWFVPNETVGISSSPILVGCLDQGLLFYLTSDGAYGIRPEPGMLHKGWMLPLVDEEENPITFTDPPQFHTYNGVVYPIKKTKESYIAVDQGKTLLFFLQFLNEILAKKKINPGISFINQYFMNLSARFEF